MEEKDVLLNAASKYFNKTDEELTELLYEKDDDGTLTLRDNAAEILIGLDSKRVQRIKDEAGRGATEKFDQGYQKAQKEVLTKFEKDLREKYGIETDKTGTELIDEVIQGMSKGGEITEETLKTHPLFLKFEGETKKQYEERIKKLNEDFEDYKKNVESEKSMSSVRSKARAAFLALNPALSDDAAKAENQIEMFLDKLKDYGYVPDEDTYVITKGDKRLEDGHGNALSFDNFIRREAEKIYDFKEQDGRQSPGNKTPGGAGGVKKKMTKKEYSQKVAEYERSGNYEAMKELSQVEIVD